MGKNQSVEDKSAEPIPPNPKTETEQPIAKKLNIFQRFYKFIVTEKDELGRVYFISYLHALNIFL
jgi:hypothetical protein